VYLEHGAQASNLFLRHASSNDLEGLLLQLVHGRKAAHALQNDIVQRPLAGSTVLTHPVMLQDAVGVCALLWVLWEKIEANVGHVYVVLNWHAAKLQSMYSRKMDAGQKQSSIGDAEHGIALSDANDDDNVTGKATNKGCSANVMRGQLKCHLNFKFLQQLGTAHAQV